MDGTSSNRWDRLLAMAAWLLVVTAFWLPWWLVRYSDSNGNAYDQIGVWLWHPQDELTTSWGPWVTGALAGIVGVWLFVRIAARSWEHEPPVWHRDLQMLAGVAGAALVSTLFWPDPDNFASFWGGVTYTSPESGAWFTETVSPGLGWWCMALAFLCLAVAAVAAPPAGDASQK